MAKHGRRSPRQARGAREAAPPRDHRAAGPPVPRRDPAADRALFEQALARLDLDADAKPFAPDDEEDRSPERRARFDKRLARGEVEPAATLDLHGLDREEATARLRSFLSAAPGEAVLIIHGRGLRILEAATIAELDRHPRVAEHLPAPRALGGHGARLVRLRDRID